MNKCLYDYYVINKAHRALRAKVDRELSAEYSALGLCDSERMARRFEYLSSLETPHIHPDEKIVFMRTVANIPDIYTEEEWAQIKKEHYIHELGYVSNLSPEYAKTISEGLLARREGADEYQKRIIDSIIALSDRYLEEAKRMGKAAFFAPCALILP